MEEQLNVKDDAGAQSRLTARLGANHAVYQYCIRKAFLVERKLKRFENMQGKTLNEAKLYVKILSTTHQLIAVREQFLEHMEMPYYVS